MKKPGEDRSPSRSPVEKGNRKKPPNLSGDSVHSETGGFLKPSAFSLLVHTVLVVFLLFSLRSPTLKNGPSVYRVTLKPFMPIGDGKPPGGSGGSGRGLPTSPPAEKLKPVESPKETDIAESIKRLEKKSERKVEKLEGERVSLSAKKEKPHTERIEEAVTTGSKGPAKKEEKLRDEKGTHQSLQEALEDIRKKAALDEIQKRVAQRDGKGKSLGEGGSTGRPSQGPVVSSSGSLPGAGPESGTGSGSGTGTGKGEGAGTGSGGSPWGSPSGSSGLVNEYYSRIWAKIKAEWTIPEDLPKGKTNLEAIIVVIIEKDGKVQKSWFEKKSGNTLYDQMAMRAIKKAEPLPPIPKEFSDNTLEIGIRFYPD